MSGGTPTRSGASSTTTSSRPAASRFRRSPAAVPSLAAPVSWTSPGTARPSHARHAELHGLLVPERRPRPKSPCAGRHDAEVRHRAGCRQHDQRERLFESCTVRSHRRHLQLHIGGRPDEAGVGRDDARRSRARSSSTAARRALRRPRSTSARGRSSSAGSTRWTTTRRCA